MLVRAATDPADRHRAEPMATLQSEPKPDRGNGQPT